MGDHDGGDGCKCDRLEYTEKSLAEAEARIKKLEAALAAHHISPSGLSECWICGLKRRR